LKEQFNIITLGYTTVGKSYYLASIFDLVAGTQPNCFTLQYHDFVKKGKFEEWHDIISGEKDGSIDTTIKLIHTPMMFQKSFKDLFKVEVTDVEGQALQPGRNEEVAHTILSYITKCDGVVLMLKAPSTPKEYKQCERQLPQLFNFCKNLLVENKVGNEVNIPVALVLNQIDMLPNVKGISKQIESELKMTSVKELGRSNKRKNRKIIEKRKGEIVSELLRNALDTEEIFYITEQFNNWVKNSGLRFPSRIFFTSSIGFDNVQENPIDSNTLIANTAIKPFGTIASFLWLLYAALKKENDTLSTFGLEDSIVDKLLEDIKDLHISGRSYFDNSDELWALRNLGNLYIIYDEE